MPYAQTAEPAALAVDVSDLKDHLRLTDASQDSVLTLYLQAATDLVEIDTSRALIQRTFRYETCRFPGGAIELPLAPLVSVEDVRYYDSAGVLQTVDGGSYNVDATGLLGRVTLGGGSVWPFTQSPRLDAVQVNFTAGYGETPNSVPPGLRMVVLYLAAHFFVNRVPVSQSTYAIDIPFTLKYAISAYKIWKA